jgi:hypothetical protein
LLFAGSFGRCFRLGHLGGHFKDKLVAGFQITALGDKLTQLVIASSVSEKGEPSPTSMVVESVLRVCKEVDVKCSVEQ